MGGVLLDVVFEAFEYITMSTHKIDQVHYFASSGMA
jgi:hypothetical protein